MRTLSSKLVLAAKWEHLLDQLDIELSSELEDSLHLIILTNSEVLDVYLDA